MIRSASTFLFSVLALLCMAVPAVAERLEQQRFPRGGKPDRDAPPDRGNLPDRSSEQDRARRDMLDSKAMPFSIIKRRTESAMAEEGTYLGVAPSPRDGVYRMQFLRKDGRVIWVDVDGKTGDIIARTR